MFRFRSLAGRVIGIKKLSDTIKRKFVSSYNVSDYQIETQNGYVDILKTNKTEKYQMFIVKLERSEIKCADTHIFITDTNDEIFAKDSLGATLSTKTGPQKVLSVTKTSTDVNMYDLSVSKKSNNLYYTNGILSHNTVTSGTYLLWLALFHPTQIMVGIVANKPKTAREVLDKIKKIFLELPIWMKTGMAIWNKSEIEFENGTRIMTDGPSSDSFRGYTCNIVYVDECIEENETITVRDKETGEIQEVTMKELEMLLC